MRILLLGAYGFIGSAIARELAFRGHAVTGVGRDCAYGQRILPQLRWVRADLSQMAAAASWGPLLDDVDVVVNASGLLQSGDGGSVEAVQLKAVRALISACEIAGVKRMIQISAAGADRNAASDFMRTKAEAEVAIEASTVPSLILRPGLVIGRNSYGGTELLRALAAVPLDLRLPFTAPIRCFALSELVEAVAEAVEPARASTGRFDLVGPEPRSLDAIIAMHREWLGLPSPRLTLKVPAWCLRVVGGAADLLGRLGWRSPLRRNALSSLECGVDGDPEQTRALLGREPLPLEKILERDPAGKQDRLNARLYLLQPLAIASLFVMWAGSGVATLVQLDNAASILAPRLGRDAAYVIAIAGGWVDIILAAGLVLRRTVRPALLTMILLTVAVYLVGGSFLVPALWVHPLAPFAKALPATVLALVAYWTLERR